MYNDQNFIEIIRTGQIDWRFESEETIFEDSFKRIEESDLVNDPDRLEKMFQEFYDNAMRGSYDASGVNKHGPIDVKRMTKETCTDTSSTTARPATTPNYFNGSTKNQSYFSIMLGFMVMSTLAKLFL